MNLTPSLDQIKKDINTQLNRVKQLTTQEVGHYTF